MEAADPLREIFRVFGEVIQSLNIGFCVAYSFGTNRTQERGEYR
jgi:hypothetical protein